MQKTKDGCRWTIRLSNKDYAQKEVIRMFEYLLATGEYATESDIFREGIKSLYREKTELDKVTDWDKRIQECARTTADNMMERMQNMLDATVRKGGLVAVAGTVADADEAVEADLEENFMARNGVQFNMWLSEEEKARIQEKANKAGISMSEYIRRCALSRKIPQYGDVTVLREISAELGKIGSNLNQIAHHLNAGGSVYSVYYDLLEVLKDWNDMRFRILKQVEDVCCGKYHHRRSA